MDGWFKLHRKITESAIFQDADMLRLWIYCLSKAAYKPTTVLIEKQEIKLEPGQFVTGRFSLHADFNSGVKNLKRVKETTLWSWLKRLESYGNLDIKSYNKYSVVTVVKWYEYQENLTTEQQQTDNKLTSDCCQTDTNKKLKNLENYKNISTSTTDDSEISIMNAFTKSFGLLVMPATIREYVKKLKESQTDEMITELMLEVGESSAKPNLRFLQAVGDRWVTEGITSRAQAKALRESQRPTPIVPTTENKRTTKSGKPIIPVVENEFDAKPVSAEEMAEYMKLAKSMSDAKKKEAEHEKSA